MTAPRWTDAELAHLQADYENSRHADDHSDVVAAIRGLRAVVALHAPTGRPDDLHCHCQEAAGNYPCPTIRAANLEV